MRTIILTSLALLVGACSFQPSAPVALQGQVVAASPSPARGVITGVVSAPAQLVAAVVPTGGGNVVPTGGGNVVPTGGGNFISPNGAGGPTGHLLMAADQPLANARVFLADAAGQPYPSLPAATTDAQGRYTFQDVPAGYSFMVVVQAHDAKTAKDVTLQTLAKSSELGATAPVDVATSLVTVAVTEGQGGQLGEVNAAAFRTATEATARSLADGEVPDLSDRTAVLAQVAKLAEAIQELRQALDAIRQDLKEIKQSLADLKAQLDNQANGPFKPQPVGLLPGANYAPPPGVQGGQPNGANGGARPGDCGPPGHFALKLKGSYEGYPLRVDFVSPYGNLILQLIFQQPGDTPGANLPTGCPHVLTLRDSVGKVLANAPSYAIPLGTVGQAELPF